MNPTDRLHSILDDVINPFRVILGSKLNPKELPAIENERINIIANGPSVKELNSSIFINEDVLCVNRFAATDLFHIIKPKYYVLVAPEFWISNVPDGYHEKLRLPTFNGLSKVDWPMIVFIDVKSTKNDFDVFLHELNSNISTVAINLNPIDGTSFMSSFLIKRKLGMPRPHNVLIPSIMVALWMGYKEINLYGVDHSWLPLVQVDEQNRVLLEQKHFYDEGKTKPRPMRNIKFEDRKLHEMLHKFYLSFKSYHFINKMAEKSDVVIQNCTPGSFIDAFPRKNINNEQEA